MDTLIVGNLFELWTVVGDTVNQLIRKDNYWAVIPENSDWPKRIFNVDERKCDMKEVFHLSRQKLLPESLTLLKPNGLGEQDAVSLSLIQRNMALDMESYSVDAFHDANIFQVASLEGSKEFARVASRSFGYHVGFEIIHQIVLALPGIKLFVYKEHEQGLGCGMVYFDSNGNAGLHMIGTLPEGRGRGIAKKMTMKLLEVAREKGSRWSVLHASQMGEPIYSKLGFQPYGELETFKILK